MKKLLSVLLATLMILSTLAVLPITSSAEPELVNCPDCNGTSKCKGCQGNSVLMIGCGFCNHDGKCTTCNGTGKVAASGPDSMPPAPSVSSTQVKAVYSAVYYADCSFADWGSGTTYAQEDYGKKITTSDLGYFGFTDFTLNCSEMEKLHMDVWFVEAGTFRVVPIHGGAEKGVTVSVAQSEVNSWKSVDIALDEGDLAQVTDWTNVYQIKIDNAINETFWVNNIYFYTSKGPHTITNMTTDKNGSITVAETAKEGDTVTVMVTPNEGYQLKSLDCSAVSASANANMLYLDIGIWGQTDPAGYFAHFQKDGGSDFGNTALVKGENNYYACEIPDGADTVTFLRVNINDFSEVWNKTSAQSIPSDKNRFAITSWSEIFGGEDAGEWTGKEIQNTKVTTKKEENGTYTFTMPAANVTVTAVFEAATEYIYLNTGGSSLWNKDGATFAVWTWGGSLASTAAVPMELESGDIYKVDKSLLGESMLFVRVVSGKTFNGEDWSADTVWNQTGDVNVPASSENCYEITGWGANDGQWTVYTPAAVPTYTVSDGTADLNGIIEIDKSTAAEKELVTITVKPASGYQLKDLNCEKEGTIPEILPDGFANGDSDDLDYVMPIPTGAWMTAGNTYAVAIIRTEYSGTELEFIKNDGDYDTFVGIPLNTKLTKVNGTTYIAENSFFEIAVTFTVEGGKLTNVNFYSADSGFTEFNGDYTAPTGADTDVDLSALEVLATGTGDTYTFTMPAANVTVTAEFEATPELTAPQVPTVAKENVKAIMCDTYKNNLGWMPQGWGNCTWSDKTISGVNFEYAETMHWDCFAFDFTTGAGVADYANLHFDIWFAESGNAPIIKLEFNGSDPTDEITIPGTFKAGWNSVNINVEYVFGEQPMDDLKCLTVKVAKEGGPVAWANILFYNGTYTSIDAAEIEYAITDDTAQDANGTITVAANAKMGDTVTVTVNPAEGYQLKALTVVDADGNPVTVTDNAFTMPPKNVTVTAEFELIPHSHKGTKQNGQAATEDAAGWKDYYKCDCDLYFEDEACTTLIGDEAALATWKTGKGAIQKLPHSHKGTKQNGQAATEDAAGFHEYFYCEGCDTYFEDENCTKTIGDAAALTTWKSEGTGYIAPTGGGNDPKDPDPKDPDPKDDDDDKGGLSTGAIVGIVIGAVAVVAAAGFCVWFFLIKKKNDEPTDGGNNDGNTPDGDNQ